METILEHFIELMSFIANPLANLNFTKKGKIKGKFIVALLW